MECKVCRGQAVGACSACGSFYWERHGGRHPGVGRALCRPCYDSMRPVATAVGCLGATSGVTFLIMAYQSTAISPGATLVALSFGLVFLALGVWQFVSSRRDHPSPPKATGD